MPAQPVQTLRLAATSDDTVTAEDIARAGRDILDIFVDKEPAKIPPPPPPAPEPAKSKILPWVIGGAIVVGALLVTVAVVGRGK
jgi:hypothetical protein